MEVKPIPQRSATPITCVSAGARRRVGEAGAHHHRTCAEHADELAENKAGCDPEGLPKRW
jgi:hypothetical protein